MNIRASILLAAFACSLGRNAGAQEAATSPLTCKVSYRWINYPFFQPQELQAVNRTATRGFEDGEIRGFVALARYEQKTFDKMLAEVCQGVESVPLIGCSGDWRRAFADDTYLDRQYVAVLTLGGDTIRTQAGCVEGIGEQPEAEGSQLGQALKASDVKLVLVFATSQLGLRPGDGSAFLSGLKAALGAEAVVLGSVLPEGEQVFCGQRNYTNAAVGMALCGPIQTAIEAFHGFEERARHKVTQSEGRRVSQLDGKTAAEVYAADVLALPRGLRNVIVSRRYPFGKASSGGTDVLYQGVAGEDGSYEFEVPVSAGQELLVLEQDDKFLAGRAKEAAGRMRERLGGCQLMLYAGDIHAGGSYFDQCDVLKGIWPNVNEGGHLLGWFGQASLTSQDGVRPLTSYVVGIRELKIVH